MLKTQRWSRRVAWRSLTEGTLGQTCRWRSDQNVGRPSRGHRERANSKYAVKRAANTTTQTENRKPSLVEQLFPEESKRYEAQQNASREIPRLPIESRTQTPTITKVVQQDSPRKSFIAQRLHAEAAQASPGTSVLVLRNASNNLTEEDFRRLIPQGRHIEGWTLQEGDILKVIPGRNLATLARENHYFLLFSSTLSAFMYQGHVSRIHKLAAMHAPSSITSPVPPPPGYMVEGLDLHSAIQAYSLVPPWQKLELRQLRPPMTPVVRSIIKYEGYPSIVKRPDKMPFEVRLTLEGPQIQAGGIRHIIMESAQARSLSWSGGNNINVKVTKWEPQPKVSAMDESVYAEQAVDDTKSASQKEEAERDGAALLMEAAGASERRKLRTPNPVYIVGFHTEGAAQSFVSYWHRRPMEHMDRYHHELEGDVAPIANVELLW
ncbi:hypothetical protein CLAFUW4_11447 [Fulvia fulva]|uniref:Uncharacterized protein n=1 Tax=Passalora fulva TaxID=5499 RepID=A0A9Q8URF6_PASFU|nr:uncharacterized protein CLAFUR5_10487 [Fulvia fulva]KAK4619954.1 hypothetical protein CLAFUR4_11453 [Fulvia fulva]KAK4620773.1 hypothetical protein CLAFUR0_11459 [Fulvia fulva]UJO19662.1 hypothetical protein CLAFUR5_10487 [Fulvia fulva]WPV17230.1 hypothetical protein CLAFUW4_11447 [Fulvia fulva]WPV32396.1 hypothetical protein CLAFUW7_11443 [Fulvia fulva]